MQFVVLRRLIVKVEHSQRRISNHVFRYSINVQHKLANVGAVEIPFVECVSWSSIESVVNKNMRCREIVRRIAEKYSKPVLKKVAEDIPYPLLVKTMIVTLQVVENFDFRKLVALLEAAIEFIVSHR